MPVLRSRPIPMKAALFVAVAITLFPSMAAARAPEGPWCALLSNAIQDCHYFTHAQCLATVSGIGGMCVPNSVVIDPRQRRRGERYKRWHWW